MFNLKENSNFYFKKSPPINPILNLSGIYSEKINKLNISMSMRDTRFSNIHKVNGNNEDFNNTFKSSGNKSLVYNKFYSKNKDIKEEYENFNENKLSKKEIDEKQIKEETEKFKLKFKSNKLNIFI
jgi:hypothetical protein